ncbi:MAG: M20/M25/M40 family metallo-hydrolase [Weeksellaceae bacterium]
MRKLPLFVFISLFTTGLFAQNSEWVYATIDVQNAQNLKANHPNQIQILESTSLVSAVYMSPEAAMELKDYGNLHGPGYIFRKNQEAALNALDFAPQGNTNVLDFTITEDAYVNQCIAMVNETNIENTILNLQNYGTRFHTKPSGVQASLDIKANWENMVNTAGRSDISVEFFNHDFTNQKSVIVSIPGTEFPDEIVVIGGHLDSGDYWIQNNAPGADDNASGIGTLTETLRILLETNFQPKRTVQIMGYAAEEVGLYGSADIAENYSLNDKNVLAVMQLDMTNYNGSDFDIAIISDAAYTSGELNLFLIDLMEHYNSSGDHPITYGISYCGYGCSDHVSWTENGYPASFPFEAAMGEDNPNIHTTNDTYAAMGSTSIHSTKFVKLALEFVIEVAKVENMSTNEVQASDLLIAVKDRNLIYQLNSSSVKMESVTVFDTGARKMIEKKNLNANGSISLQEIPNGFYIAIFKDANGKAYSKKFLIK